MPALGAWRNAGTPRIMLSCVPSRNWAPCGDFTTKCAGARLARGAPMKAHPQPHGVSWGPCLFAGVLLLCNCGGQPASSAGTGPASPGGGAAATGDTAGAGGAGAAGSPAIGGSGNECNRPLSSPDPKQGRPEANACPPAPDDIGSAGAAGTATCATDADCSNSDLAQNCVQSVCAIDGCLVDSDCGPGEACACAPFPGGYGGNHCVSAECRVNADCGPGGVCAPSRADSCGRIVDGYHCHAAADSCNTDADCCATTPSCRYDSSVGHWNCETALICNG
jgi:hypothetical protein